MTRSSPVSSLEVAGSSSSRGRRLFALVVGAFALRLLVRVAVGPESFLDDSYFFYRKIAITWLSGAGACVAPGVGCALRTPLYPLMIAPFVATDTLYPGVVLLQAAAGAAMVWVTYVTGRALFSDAVGWWAAVAVAASPYAAMHDTALQETVFVNLFTLLAISALTIATPARRAPPLLAAGLALAAAVLTTARVALFVPAVLMWLVGRRSIPWRRRLSDATLVALPIVVLIGGWVVRNWQVVGAPVLTTESGASLFYANNEWTFSRFPRESIDLSAQEAVAHLSAERRSAMTSVVGSPVAEDRLAARWAWAFVRTRPGQAARGALRKLWVVVSAEFSPARGVIVQIGYRVVFLAVHILAAVGLWRVRHRGPPHGVSYAVLAAFLVTTAVFWAHTSHKTVIDAVLFIYAASVWPGAARA